MNDLFEQALAAEGMTGRLADIARSIYLQESGGGKNTKTSNAGAHGGMQIIPSTFASVADKGWDINNPLHNARAGIRYVNQMYKLAGGDPVLTGAGYYGGPGGLEKARKGIAVSDPRNPNAPTTLQYGQKVASRLIPKKGQDAPVQPVPLARAEVPVVTAPVESAGLVLPEVPQQPATQAPVQVAQAPQVVPETQPPVVPEEWAALQQVMGTQAIRPNDLNFGPGLDAQGFPAAPPVRAKSVQPNFASMLGWKGKNQWQNV